MGLFRIILALSVFMAHAPDYFGKNLAVSQANSHIYIGSGHAVFAFFILSGFYMAMVICQKYSKLESGAQRFYLNRALRLYPTNWAILALYAVFFFVNNVPSFLTLHTNPGKEWLTPVALFCNFFFLGAEIIPFKDLSNWQYVIGPIWSLSVEAYFYVVAPFIVTRSVRFIALLAVASASLRFGLHLSGFGVVPWRYFFFPSDLVFFLLGALAYRAYDRIKDAAWLNRAGPVAAVALLGFLCFKPFWMFPDLDQWQCWGFYALVCVCTPLVFHWTRNSRIDNLIGQFAYPVYLGHMLVFTYVLQYYHGAIDKSVVSLIATIALSAALYFGIDRPIEHIRKRISRRSPNPARADQTVNGHRASSEGGEGWTVHGRG